ncbi:signal transducer and activator of transcription 5B-like isoform X2 [Clavelina lepadiformis]|uniref:Signal transducer and activator of transcription n=2 Tax=Clavelina lepadiformis TaxID=159417 RepID=A0ABP0FI89_CLALP
MLQFHSQIPSGDIGHNYNNVSIKQEFPDTGIDQLHASSFTGSQQGMSLWAKVRELEGDSLRQIQNLYGPHFPIEFRHYFADIIERQNWDQLDPDNIPNDEPHAKFILETFLGEIQRQCDQLTEGKDFLQRLHFSEIATHFKNVYGPAPLELVRTVKKILSFETRLVQNANSMVDGGMQVRNNQQSEKTMHINRELERLAAMTRNTENDLRKLQSKQEYFVINYQDSLKISSDLQQIQQLAPTDQTRIQLEPQLTRKQQEIDKLLRAEAQKLQQLRSGLATRHEETFSHITQLQGQILDEELLKWKRSQALAYNGVQHENNLDQLQRWCEQLAEIIWQNRQQIKRVEMQRQQLPINNSGHDKLPELNSTITALLSTLVTNTFIIEKQPPQVLKTQTRFGATIRLLVGGKLNVHMNPPTVKASIISENQAKALLKNDSSRSISEMSGEILNPESVMEYHPQSGILSVNFRNMSLRRIKRSDKRGAESVTEEKFTILFQSRFSVGGNELVFQVRTLSLPVVVIVHGNQEANAAASILWDNAFAEQGRIPFQIPDKVPWCKLIETLDYKWKHECHSPRGLSPQAKQYLAYKVFRHNVPSNSDKHISWAQFNREPLPNRNFTFWQWFNGVMELTKSKHLQQHWNDGAIIGFIGKAESQEKLLSKSPATFLLRYSDSEIAGLTIAWVAESDKGILKVWNLQPQTLRDYGIRSLADRIKDLDQLMYICKVDDSTQVKDEVFGQYYNKPMSGSPQPDGYVRAEIKQTVNIPHPHMSLMGEHSAPGTPASSYESQLSMHSPTPVGHHAGLQYDMPDMGSSVNNYHPPQDVAGGGMEYDESLDCFAPCNIDVNELLSRQL